MYSGGIVGARFITPAWEAFKYVDFVAFWQLPRALYYNCRVYSGGGYLKISYQCMQIPKEPWW